MQPWSLGGEGGGRGQGGKSGCEDESMGDHGEIDKDVKNKALFITRTPGGTR